MATDPRLLPFVAPAQASHAKFYPRGPFVSITLAQWIDESAWGAVTSGKNNYFGIKATEAQILAGKATQRWTHETLRGVYQKVTDYFADYDSVEDCFDAHAALLCTPWYARCVAAKTPADYAHALWECDYATGIPGHPYDSVLIGIMNTYDLYQFDEGGPFAAEPAS